MLYILGGSPRSGKSIIARRFVEEEKIPYFCVDYLITSLQDGVPDLGIKHGQPFISKAESLWPTVKPLLKELIHSEPRYLIEGDGILPNQASEIIKEFPDGIKACFVGYTTISREAKLVDVREFVQESDWTKERSDESMLGTIDSMIKFSKYIKEEAERLSIEYFDVSSDFKGNLDKIFQFLTT